MFEVETENGTRFDDPSPQELADLVEALSLPDNGFLVYERAGTGEDYVQTCLRDDGHYWLEYRDGHARRHYVTTSTDRATTLRALLGWASQSSSWRDEFSWEHAYPVPERIPVGYEPDFRTDLIGTYDGGLFLAGFSRTTYLHLFDHEGRHQRSEIALAEQVLGESAATDDLMRHLADTVAALPGYAFGTIEVRPFQVEHGGRVWGLIDETEEYGFPHVELHPDDLGFNPPWDGLYDT